MLIGIIGLHWICATIAQKFAFEKLKSNFVIWETIPLRGKRKKENQKRFDNGFTVDVEATAERLWSDMN